VIAARLHLSVGVLLFASALCVSAARARAALALSLSWSAPSGCPSRDAVVGEIRRLLGGSIENPRGISARAEIEARSGGDYQLHIALRSDQGERMREVEAPTCAELADAAALIIALAIDPNAVANAPETPPSPASPSPVPSETEATSATPAPAPTPSESPAPPPTSPPWSVASLPSAAPAPPPPRSDIHAHAEIACEYGAFRHPSLMGRVGAAYARGPLRLEIMGLFAWAGRIAALQAPTKGGSFWLAGGGLAGCYERPLDAAGLPGGTAAACAGVEVGAMGAAAYGVLLPSANTSPWVAPFAAGLVRWAFRPRVALRLDLAAFVPLVRADFTIDGVGVTHRPGILGARAGAGVEVLLGSF
jgi:hypothetical protein